jgi:hypothetical protein
MFFSLQAINAEDIRLMSFFRVNYYTNKTYVFDVNVDSNCRINQKNPLSSYFIVSNGNSKKIEALTGNNKKLFTPKVLGKNSSKAVFSLGIFSHKLFKSTYPKDVKFQVEVFNSSNGCRAEVQSFIDDQLLFDRLERIEAKLTLHSSGLLKGHPKGLSWLRFIERNSSDCLVGNCQ